MQPVRLTLRGVSTYPETTEIDFTLGNLFAVVGPTGSGKSSIVDAITFALYGAIPRLGANTIEPFMNVSAQTAMVSLEFTIKQDLYRAVRRIKRTKTGASTSEATLESIDLDGNVLESLAKTAEEVGMVVEEKIGLTYKEFNRVVMLPQGAFANLLTAGPTERQKLLSNVLGTDIYERVRVRSNEQAKQNRLLSDQLKTQELKIGAYDANLVSQAERQLTQLAAATKAIETIEAERIAMRERYTECLNEVKQARQRLLTLTNVSPVPQPLREHEAMLAGVNKELDDAETLYEQQSQREQTLDSTLIDKSVLQGMIALHAQTSVIMKQAQQAVEQELQLITTAENQDATVATLTQEREALTAALAKATTDNLAAQIATTLKAGDACPVCSNVVTSEQLMNHNNHDLVVLQREQQAAVSAVQQAEREQTKVNLAREQARKVKRQTDADLDLHAKQIATILPLEEAKQQLDLAVKQEQEVATLRTALRATHQRMKQAKERAAKLVAERQQYVKIFDDQRLQVGSNYDGIPELTNELQEDWGAFYAWAQDKAALQQGEVTNLETKLAEITDAGVKLKDQIATHLQTVQITDTTNPLIALNNAKHEADLVIKEQAKKAEDLKELQAELKALQESEAVYTTLGALLGSSKFQAWILEEATNRLVAAAGVHLNALSQGRFSLTIEQRAICIIDETNANAVRNVSTLSGGETFLASLALALALAEYIAHMSVSAVALESLFIDEGFGTLDAETLDIAANALEILGAGKRMVGVITHVPELANRMPLRYVVTKKAGVASVTTET